MNPKKFKIQCYQRLVYLEDLLKKTTNMHKQIEIEHTITSLKDILESFTTCKKGLSPRESLYDEFFFIENNKREIELLNTFNGVSKIDTEKSPRLMRISKKDFYTLIHDFFALILDDEMFKYFIYFFQNKENFIHSINTEESFEIFLPFYKEGHIVLNEDEDWLYLFRCLCHEIGHIIVEFFNPKYNGIDSLFQEIPSVHFEILSLDYLKSIPDFQEIATQELHSEFNNYLLDSQIILLQEELYERFCQNPKNSIRDIPKIIEILKDENNNSDLNLAFENEILLSSFTSENLLYSLAKIVEQKLFILCANNREYYYQLLRKIANMNWHLPNRLFEKSLISLNLISDGNFDTLNYKRMIMEKKSNNF